MKSKHSKHWIFLIWKSDAPHDNRGCDWETRIHVRWWSSSMKMNNQSISQWILCFSKWLIFADQFPEVDNGRKTLIDGSKIETDFSWFACFLLGNEGEGGCCVVFAVRQKKPIAFSLSPIYFCLCLYDLYFPFSLFPIFAYP